MIGAAKKKLNVLAVAPHPDDLEIGCAGTLIQLARAGHSLHLAVMTKGAAGGQAEKRWAEQQAVARFYKAKSLRWMGFEDTRISPDKAGIDALEKVMRDVEPDLVFAPWGEDSHQDHRHTAAIVRSATRYTPNVLFYEVPSTIDFLPDVYVDITKQLAAKEKALRLHKSQVNRVNVADLSIIDCARAMAHFRGYQGRVKAAEGFKALRLRLGF